MKENSSCGKDRKLGTISEKLYIKTFKALDQDWMSIGLHQRKEASTLS